jgi:hypothetical protein
LPEYFVINCEKMLTYFVYAPLFSQLLPRLGQKSAPGLLARKFLRNGYAGCGFFHTARMMAGRLELVEILV